MLTTTTITHCYCIVVGTYVTIVSGRSGCYCRNHTEHEANQQRLLLLLLMLCHCNGFVVLHVLFKCCRGCCIIFGNPTKSFIETSLVTTCVITHCRWSMTERSHVKIESKLLMGIPIFVDWGTLLRWHCCEAKQNV